MSEDKPLSEWKREAEAEGHCFGTLSRESLQLFRDHYGDNLPKQEPGFAEKVKALLERAWYGGLSAKGPAERKEQG